MISDSFPSLSCGCPAAEQGASSESSFHMPVRAAACFYLHLTGSTSICIVSSWLQEWLLWLGLCLSLATAAICMSLHPETFLLFSVLDTGLVCIGQASTQNQKSLICLQGKQDILPSVVCYFNRIPCPFTVNSQTVKSENYSRHLPKFTSTHPYLGICCLRALSYVSSPTGWLLGVPQRLELESLDSKSEGGLVDCWYKWTTADTSGPPLMEEGRCLISEGINSGGGGLHQPR